MRGVILALDGRACPGRRPFAHWPTPLIPLANRPLAHHALLALRAAGVREVVVLAGPRAQPALRRGLPDGRDWGVHVSHLRARPGGELLALLGTPGALGDGPVVVHRGDALLGDGLEPALLADLEGAVRLTRPAHAFAAEEAPLGVDLLAPEALHALGGIAAEANPWLSLAAALERLPARGVPVRSLAVAGSWPMGDTTDALLEGHRFALDGIQPAWDPGVLRGGRVEGRVVIDPSALVERSLVRGPAVIGPHVRLRDAYVGPYTAIGAGSVIENTEIEHALLLRDVTIRDVSWRLERSIVGERARIARTFRLPQAINLCLGEDAEISVS